MLGAGHEALRAVVSSVFRFQFRLLELKKSQIPAEQEDPVTRSLCSSRIKETVRCGLKKECKT